MVITRRIWRRFFRRCLLLLCLPMMARGDDARKDYVDAATALETGRFQRAATLFSRSAKAYGEGENYDIQLRALYNKTLACRALGNYKLAFNTINEATGIAEKLPPDTILRWRLRLQGLTGSLGACSRFLPTTRSDLEAGLTLAMQEEDWAFATMLYTDLATVEASHGDYENARNSFERAAKTASLGALSTDVVRLETNRAMLENNVLGRQLGELNRFSGLPVFRNELERQVKKTRVTLDSQLERLNKLYDNASPGFDRALLALNLGILYRTHYEQEENREVFQKAFHYFNRGLEESRRINAPSFLGSAYGEIATLYGLDKRFEEALRLTREALGNAQKARSADGMFRWNWQCGQYLFALGDIEKAVEAFEASLVALSDIRHDVAIGFGNRNLGQTFRESVGPLFFQYVAARLKLLDARPGQFDRQKTLKRCQEVVETFKSAELEDYFRDDCVNIALQRNIGKAGQADPRAAVIYTIPTGSELEILVDIKGSLHRATSTVNQKKLEFLAHQFRMHLEHRGSFRYFDEAESLYQLIIAPVLPLLRKNNIETLVFVPDGPLRTIPMAALYDGERYLIEQFAISILPGLSLSESGSRSDVPTTALAGLLSESVQGFSALPFAKEEVKILSQTLPSHIMENQRFLRASFIEMVQRGTQSVVHIASHGEFRSVSGDSYVLTYDDRITLDELEQMIRPRQFNETPVELLVLSACRSAAGDDRAALGMAGVALKAGARSAMATLWYVDDEASSQLVTGFYDHWQRNNTSKAEALRQAQMELLNDPRFEHPCYWSPYMIIGNWL